jgi:hypothetical protein
MKAVSTTSLHTPLRILGRPRYTSAIPQASATDSLKFASATRLLSHIQQFVPSLDLTNTGGFYVLLFGNACILVGVWGVCLDVVLLPHWHKSSHALQGSGRTLQRSQLTVLLIASSWIVLLRTPDGEAANSTQERLWFIERIHYAHNCRSDTHTPAH